MTAPRGLPESLADLGRCLVVGVVNVTPDSFSDGGRWLEPDAAIRHGLDLRAAGADLVDVGGESTRPGATRVPPEEEAERVLPVVQGLVEAGVSVSIDTMHAATAAAALEAGACLVNDVSGGLADPDMAAVLSRSTVPYVAMHWRGHSEVMQDAAVYDDVLADVTRELAERLEALAGAGVDPERIVLDPGLGFAKLPAHNWAVLSGIDAVQALGRPVLVGASRKSFLGEMFAGADGEPAPPERRDPPTAALTALLAAAGVWAVRVHDVGPSADAVRVAAAMTGAPLVQGRHGRRRRSTDPSE